MVLDARHRGEVELVALAVPRTRTEAERLRALLERQLAGLTTELREAIVCSTGSPASTRPRSRTCSTCRSARSTAVADALAALDPELRTADSVRLAAATIDVPPPPYDEVAARVRERPAPAAGR